jgi:hypothetical protein
MFGHYGMELHGLGDYRKVGGGRGWGIPGGMSRKLVESLHGICFFYPPSGKLSTALLRSFFACCLHRSVVFLVVSLLQGWWRREGKGDDKNDVLVKKKKKVQEKSCQKNHGIEGRF